MEENKMALQTDVQQEARTQRHTDRRLHPDGDGAVSPVKSGNSLSTIRHLGHLLEGSARMLRHTSENVENRGLKLLLKVMAQERVAMVNALRQMAGKELEDPLDPAHKSTARSLQEGMQDIQSSMTVQREGRENVAMTHLLDEEETLLDAYDDVLQGNSSLSYRDLLEAQRAHVAQFYGRLRGADMVLEPIVARVFDTRHEGESAVSRLRERGLDASQVDVATISQVAQPILRTTERTASPKSTVGAGALSGALIGGLVGLALAAFVWFAPQLVGWVTVGPWALLIGAIAFGAFFGSVIGFFIGQNQREIDLAETADGLLNGEVLVAAYPRAEQVAMVEDVLQVHHARELNR
jgi:hypothetical protein